MMRVVHPRESIEEDVLLQRTLVANGTSRHFAATQQTVAFRVKPTSRVVSAGPARTPPVER